MTRVVLVTGGARGIGRAVADDLARDHHVAITWHSGREEAEAFAAGHEDALAIRCDLAEADPEALLRQVIDRFGRLDLLVNNAGLVLGLTAERFDAAAAARVMQVNALMPMALMTAALAHMPPGSAVVNISSVNARQPPLAALEYAASKAALESLTRGAAKALGPHGIRVNAVAPGAVERAHAPRSPDSVAAFEAESALGRLASAAEVAAAVRFLLSDAASGITGEVLTVSAGYRL